MNNKGAIIRNLTILLTAIVLSGVIASCNRQPTGIFASLETEIDVEEDRGIPNDATVTAIVRPDGGNYLFAAAGGIHYREVGAATEWTRIASPDGSDVKTTSAMRVFGDTIYAIFGREVYSIDLDDDGEPEGTSSDDWQPVGGLADDQKAHRLFTAIDANGDDALYLSVSVEDTSRYGLYQLNDNDDEFKPVVSPPEGDDAWDHVYDVVRYQDPDDPNEDGLWIIAGDSIFFVDDNDDVDEIKPKAQRPDEWPSTPKFRQAYLYDDDGDDVLYLAGNGRIVRYDGSDWQRSDDHEVRNETVEFRSLTVMSIEDANGSSYETLLAGSRSRAGLFEAVDLELVNLRRPLRPQAEQGVGTGNYEATALSITGVKTFLVDDDHDEERVVFAGSVGAGLWRGSYDSELESFIWMRE